ncbi:MAG: hypothetical protein KF762_17200 [Acidobacteria bacterium]|nr:hypothetical protein [Acidobacteriota bacterium]
MSRRITSSRDTDSSILRARTPVSSRACSAGATEREVGSWLDRRLRLDGPRNP